MHGDSRNLTPPSLPQPPWRAPALLGMPLRALFALALIGIAQTTATAAAANRLYAPCVVCHQPQAWGSPDGNIPSLADQQKSYLEKQFLLFRSGARVDTAMQLVAVHPAFDDKASIAALSGYLAALNADPTPVTGAGDHLEIGREIYAHICTGCHGFDGQGNAGNRVPRIGGQHYPYLRRQIEKAARLHLDLAPPEMTSALRGMPDEDKDALADYTSRLGNVKTSSTPP